MTTVPQVRPDAIALPVVGTGERQRRRQERRRLGRQQMLVVLLMVVALVVTVAVLAQQWLATGVAGGGNQGLHAARAGILVSADQSVPTNPCQPIRPHQSGPTNPAQPIRANQGEMT